MPLTPPFVPVGGGADLSGALDTVDWQIAVTPEAGAGGIAIKIPSAEYGVSANPYTTGEFVFAVLEEGAGDATDNTGAGSVLWRVDAYGATGGTGPVHIAVGYRKTLPENTACLWIDPYQDDVAPIVVQAPTDGAGGAVIFMIDRFADVIVDTDLFFDAAKTAGWFSDTATIIDSVGVLRINWPSAGVGFLNCRVGSESFSRAQLNDDGIRFGPGSTAPDARLSRVATGVLYLGTQNAAVGAVLQMQERTAPSAPAANNVYLYAEDNGSGKTRLMALFSSGAAQQVAIQP